MFTIWNLNFHSDMAAANILAREQIRTGQWLPESWNTSTGLFLVFYNLLIIPLSIFTENQILLRNLAVLIYVIAFVILLRHLSKKYLQSNCYLVFLCFFFSNTSPIMRDMAFIEAAYLPALLESIVLLILVLKAFDSRFAVKNRRWCIGLLLYIAYLSLSGTLNMAYQVIPLLGAIVLYILLENWNKPYELLRSEIPSWLKAISAVLASVIIGLLGYKLLVAYTGFQTGTNITYPESSNLANKFVEYILSAIGYRTNVNLFSLAGLMNAVIVFGFIAVIVCCVLLFIRYREQTFPVKILMHFALVVNAIHLYLIFTHYCLNLGEIRYLFRPMMFLWLLAAYYIYKYILKKGFLLKIVAAAAILAFSVPYMLPGLLHVAHYPQNREHQLGLVNFLKEQGLEHGYATFWNAGKHMVLSDFEIEIGGVLLNESITPFYWLSSDTTYDPNAYEGESFLLLTQEENAQFNAHSLGEPVEVLTYDGYVIYRYSYNIMGTDPAIQNANRIPVYNADAITVVDSNGEIAVHQFAFQPEANTYYRISFICDVESSQMVTVDLCAGPQYDDDEQQAVFHLSEGENACSGILWSGESDEFAGNIVFRVISTSDEEYVLRNFEISMLEKVG